MAILVLGTMLMTGPATAQLTGGLNFNIGNQPAWGPTGYDHVDYYYLPDIETYYSVPEHKYYYYEGGRWIGRSQLPPRFHDYDVYHSYKVVVNERQPYRVHAKYRDQYVSYKGRHDQEVIRDSRDAKYFVNRNHPEHNKWVLEQKKNGNGNNGNGRGNGKNQGNKHNGKKHGN